MRGRSTLVVLAVAGLLAGPAAAQAQSGTGPLAVENRPVERKADADSGQDGRDQAVMMLMQELERYERETRELRNLVEKLQHRLEQMKKAQRERYLDLDTRLNALAEASTRDREEKSGDTGSETEGEQPDPEADRQAYQKAFQEGRDKLLARNFEAAAQAFQGYLDDHPEGSFRPFAHFWLGEVYRNLDGREADALKHFRTVVEDYPEHSKTPAALYKLASLQAEQGNAGKARVTLEKLRMKFPDSREAELAKGMLEQLGEASDG